MHKMSKQEFTCKHSHIRGDKLIRQLTSSPNIFLDFASGQTDLLPVHENINEIAKLYGCTSDISLVSL